MAKSNKVRISVRSLSRLRFNEKHVVYNLITAINNPLFIGFYKAHTEGDSAAAEEWSKIKSLDAVSLTEQNVRALDPKGRGMKDLANVVYSKDHYALAATPISAFAFSLLAQHPKTGDFVNPDSLSASDLEKVTILEIEVSIVDGQHRAFTFGEVVLRFKKEFENGKLVEIPVRETRMALLSGFDPVADIDLMIDIATGHNRNRPVTDATIENKKGHFEPLKIALGVYSSAVEWVQNAAKKMRAQMYKPFEIIQLVQAIRAPNFCEASVRRADMQFDAEQADYAPWLPHLLLLLKAYEIIRFKSSEMMITRKGINLGKKFKDMFEDTSKRHQTATLGDIETCALNKTFSLVILNSFRHLFSQIGDQVSLNLASEEAFLEFVHFALENYILDEVAERGSALSHAREFVREPRKGVLGKIKPGSSKITYEGAYLCTKANKEAYLKWAAPAPVTELRATTKATAR